MMRLDKKNEQKLSIFYFNKFKMEIETINNNELNSKIKR